MKCVHIRSFFLSVFSCIRTEYGISLRILSELGKIRTRKNSVFGHFSRSVFFKKSFIDETIQMLFPYYPCFWYVVEIFEGYNIFQFRLSCWTECKAIFVFFDFYFVLSEMIFNTRSSLSIIDFLLNSFSFLVFCTLQISLKLLELQLSSVQSLPIFQWRCIREIYQLSHLLSWNLDSYLHAKKIFFLYRNARAVSYYFIQDT